MPRIDRAELNRGLRLLGVDLQPVVQAASVTEAGDRLIRVRERARKALKRLARSHHPDVTGGDEARAAEFVAANNANDWLQTAQVRPRAQRQPWVTMWQGVPVTHSPSGARFYNFRSRTTTSTTAAPGIWSGTWTIIR